MRTILDKKNWRMVKLSARLEEEISTLQIELSREIEKRQECINYAGNLIEAFKLSRTNRDVCWKLRRMYEIIQKSEKTIAGLQKILGKKVKEYELMNSPLSTSVQLETSRRNSLPTGSVGYKHVHKGSPVGSKDAATSNLPMQKTEAR